MPFCEILIWFAKYCKELTHKIKENRFTSRPPMSLDNPHQSMKAYEPPCFRRFPRLLPSWIIAVSNLFVDCDRHIYVIVDRYRLELPRGDPVCGRLGPARFSSVTFLLITSHEPHRPLLCRPAGPCNTSTACSLRTRRGSSRSFSARSREYDQKY